MQQPDSLSMPLHGRPRRNGICDRNWKSHAPPPLSSSAPVSGQSACVFERSSARWRSFSDANGGGRRGRSSPSPERCCGKYSSSGGLVCANCGDVGHAYRQCTKPVTSYGIICFHVDRSTGEPRYLMVQRRDTLAYVEFMRGKYDVDDEPYIRRTLELMSPGERAGLATGDFPSLWKALWKVNECARFLREFEVSRQKFSTLVDRRALQRLLAETSARFEAAEWGFPKGRRNIGETDMECAIREFTEESGMSQFRVGIMDHLPTLDELFTGTNGMRYRHVYYIARMNDVHVTELEWVPKTSNLEVQKIAWMTRDDVLARGIRAYHTERREVFEAAHAAIVASLDQRKASV